MFRNKIQTNIENPVRISWDVKTKYLRDPLLNLLFNVTKMSKITENIILFLDVDDTKRKFQVSFSTILMMPPNSLAELSFANKTVSFTPI